MKLAICFQIICCSYPVGLLLYSYFMCSHRLNKCVGLFKTSLLKDRIITVLMALFDLFHKILVYIPFAKSPFEHVYTAIKWARMTIIKSEHLFTAMLCVCSREDSSETAWIHRLF